MAITVYLQAFICKIKTRNQCSLHTLFYLIKISEFLRSSTFGLRKNVYVLKLFRLFLYIDFEIVIFFF